MTKRIQFTTEQLDYLTSAMEERMVTPSISPEYQLLNTVQQAIVDKLYDGYDTDENGDIIR